MSKLFIVKLDNDEIEESIKSLLYEEQVKSPTEDDYIQSLADREKVEFDQMKAYLDRLDKFSPGTALRVLLREIAIDFDKDYEGNIEDSEEIWCISTTNGKIYQMDKSKIKNYRYFAAFRSKEDAIEAHAILSKRIRKMFSGK